MVWREVPAALLLTVVWFVSVRPLRRSDLLVFLTAGQHVAAGVNPYPALGDPNLYGGSAFVYPFLTAFFFVPLAVLPLLAADVLYFVVEGAAIVAACRLAGLRGAWTPVLVLATTVAIRGMQVGSVNALLFLGCVACWRWRDHPNRVAVLMTLMVGGKLFLWPLLGWLLLSGRRSALLRSAGLLASFFSLGFVLGPVGLRTYATMLSLLSEHESQQGMSLIRLLSVLMPAGFARGACVALALTAIGAAAWWARTHPEDEVVLFVSCLVAALMLTPILWLHYLVLAFVPLLLCRPTRWSLLAAFSVAWILSRPAGIAGLLPLTFNLELLGVWLCVALLPVIGLWRIHTGPEPG